MSEVINHIELPLFLYGWLCGVSLMGINVFYHSWLLWVACIPCFFVTVISPEVGNGWIQAGAVVVIILCGVKAWLIQSGRE